MHTIFIIFFSVVISSTALSRTCYIPSSLDNEASGDTRFSKILGCDQYYIDKFWDDFNMLEFNWNDGFGYHNVCNNNFALGRMMNSILALHITKSPRYKNSILNWAYNYTEGNITTLTAACGDGTLNARNRLSVVTIFMSGIYGDQTVIRRAGILLHEARHTSKPHNGGNSCNSGASCDSSWHFKGSNQYHVLWLWWYGRHSKHSTEALRNDALRDARWRHDDRFVLNPGKNI
jgi:hypothetical protein